MEAIYITPNFDSDAQTSTHPFVHKREGVAGYDMSRWPCGLALEHTTSLSADPFTLLSRRRPLRLLGDGGRLDLRNRGGLEVLSPKQERLIVQIHQVLASHVLIELVSITGEDEFLFGVEGGCGVVGASGLEFDVLALHQEVVAGLTAVPARHRHWGSGVVGCGGAPETLCAAGAQVVGCALDEVYVAVCPLGRRRLLATSCFRALGGFALLLFLLLLLHLVITSIIVIVVLLLITVPLLGLARLVIDQVVRLSDGFALLCVGLC